VKRRFSALLLSGGLFLVPAGALAADSEASVEPPAALAAVKQRTLAVPRAVAGVIAGLTIGVPVRISKDVRRQTRLMAGTLRQDVGSDFGLIENAFVMGGAVGYGLVGGTILGVIHGSEQAITYGSHQPFSKESFCLKETAQEPDKK
jgi:hypothetical protein